MPTVSIPYGKTFQTLQVPDGRFAGTLVSGLHGYDAGKGPEALVEEALARPVGSPPLRALARGKKKVTVIVSDHTRPVPSRVILPPMLREIRAGNPEAEITLLVATGCHRGTTPEELAEKLGPGIAARERIVVHDCDDEGAMVRLGTLPSGGALVLNRAAAEADLLAAEGFIEPHFFAGFSGGRKSVLPGVAARETVLYNHNGRFIADARARTGVLEGNPIHADMLYAARAARLAFIVNVVLNAEKRTVCAVAGDAEQAHAAGCAFLSARCGVKRREADIVVTSNGGWPLDQNIYQAVKGMTAAEAAVRRDGVIIMLAQAGDGPGGEAFYRTFRDEPDCARLTRRFLDTPPEETVPDQWESQIFARILARARVIFVSDAPDALVREMHMLPARSAQEALALADALLADRGIRDGSVLVIPDGVSVVVLP